MPEDWHVRLIDENIQPAAADDFAWADVILVSGMHIQAAQIRSIHTRGKAFKRVTVLGGPSVSSSPEMYPKFDYLHIGEVGDVIDALIARLDQDITPPKFQQRFDTREPLPLSDFPLPAYGAVPLVRYLIGSLQFSNGCPYRCESCSRPSTGAYPS